MDSEKMAQAKKLIDGGRYREACAFFSTDLAELRLLIPMLSTHDSATAVCWLNTLLKNPFELGRVFDPGELTVLESFLFEQLERQGVHLRKVVVADIALLLNNYIVGGTRTLKQDTDVLLSADGAECFVMGNRVSKVDFFGILNQLSRLHRSFAGFLRPCEWIDVSDADSVTVKRHKIKIRSHLSTHETAKDDVQYLTRFMNYDDTKLGWTLSKSIFRISRFLNKETVVDCIMSMLGGDIFGDEQIWINALTTLSLFRLNKTRIGRVSFVEPALVYDREFISKSVNLRETALFFLWCCMRMSDPVGGHESNPHLRTTCQDAVGDDMVYLIVAIGLFDRDFKCRRAAASWIGEFAGRSTEEDLRVLFGPGAGAIYKIDPGAVKRPETCLSIFSELPNKRVYEKYVRGMLFHYQRSIRVQAAMLIAEFYSPSEIKTSLDTLLSIDGYNLLVHHHNARMHTSTGDALMRFEGDFNVANFMRCRNVEFAVESYLNNYLVVDDVLLKKNVLFLITKNTGFSDRIADIVSHLCGDLPFSKSVSGLAARNECGLISNSLNTPFTAGFLEICKRYLGGGKNVAASIRALKKHMSVLGCAMHGTQKKELELEIRMSLDDYSVDHTGDAGYAARKESFSYFIEEGDPVQHPFIGGFVVRFLADKSKKLRDETIRLLLRNGYEGYRDDFVYLKEPAFGEDRAHRHRACRGLKNVGVETQLGAFFKKHAECIQSMSNDEAYFSALFYAFGGQDNGDFHTGIVSTLATADRVLFNIIVRLIDGNFGPFVGVARSFLCKTSVFLLPALRFFLFLRDLGIAFDVGEQLGRIDPSTLTPGERKLFNKFV